MGLRCFHGRDPRACDVSTGFGVGVYYVRTLEHLANIPEGHDCFILDRHDGHGWLRIADFLAVSVVFHQRRFRVEG